MIRLLPLLFSFLFFAHAQETTIETPPETNAEAPLVVAVREVPPFAMKDSAGNWEGLSIELWQDVADKLNREFDWQELPLGQTIDALESGEADVAVAALTATAERERSIDFSHPYYLGGLALGQANTGGNPWLATLRGFISWEFLSTVATLAFVLLVAGFAVWLFERRANPDEFGSGLKGLMAGFWWSAVTMTTVGYGDKAPKTLGGRIVGLIWMFASLIIIAGFTASIAASLTAHRLDNDRLRGRDLSEMKVAVMADSSAESYATNHGAEAVAFASISKALEAVKNESVDAVLHDAPLLKRYARTSDDWLEVSPRLLTRDDYAFGLTNGSPLREEINEALLSILNEPVWQSIQLRHLGSTDD